MARDEHEPSGDDFQAEVSHVGSPAGSSPEALARSPLEPRLTTRRRAIRLVATGVAGLLVVALVLGSIPSVRGQVGAALASLRPTPTPTAAPGEGFFYLLPNPPGVDVSVDGRTLATLPYLGDIHPLYLAQGHHVLSWHSRLFPFPPLTCTVTVFAPRAPGNPCAFVSQATLNQEQVSARAPVIATHLSLAALAPDEASQLTSAIQQALDASRSSALVQPGEHYFHCQPSPSCDAVVATQPLRATLRYQLDSEPSYPEPCVLEVEIPCRAVPQDCTQLCTVPVAPPAVAGADPARTWVAVALVSAMWTYTTLGGQVVASDQEAFGLQQAVLGLTWDTQGWHVAPVFGHSADLPVVDDAVCDPARYWLSQTSLQFMLIGPPPGGTARFASDGTPADGCVAVLDQQSGNDKPAIFLERFGVLLAVNDVDMAGNRLPIANASESHLAEQLLAQLQP